MTETKMTATLPTLDVEIVHRQFPDEDAEAMVIKLKATPSFQSALGLFPPLLSAQLAASPMFQPMMLWTRWMEAMWSPWLQMAGLPLSHHQQTALPSREARQTGDQDAARAIPGERDTAQ